MIHSTFFREKASGRQRRWGVILKNLLKKLLKLLTMRVTLVGVSILVQAVFLAIVILSFGSYFVYFYALSLVISLIVVLIIVNGQSNPAYKIAWIVPILLFPVFGGLFYLLLGGNHMGRWSRREDAVGAKADGQQPAKQRPSDSAGQDSGPLRRRTDALCAEIRLLSSV